MSVYIDPMNICIRSKKWPYDQACHLIADSIEELHEFAAALGLHRSWFQDHNIPHYDLTKGMRAKAFRLGAVSVSIKEFVKLTKQQRTTGGQ